MELVKKLEKDPMNPDLHREYGLQLLEENRVDEAVEVFSKGLVYNPFDPVMRFWRGRKYIGREMFTQSAGDLKLAAMIKPEDWECWYYLGVACYLAGMYEEAKTAHSKSREMMIKYGPDMVPGGSEGYFERVLVYNGTRDADEVLAEAEAKDDHMFATGAYGLAVYFECVTGEKEKAGKILKRIAQRDDTWGGFAEHAAAERLKTWNE